MPRSFSSRLLSRTTDGPDLTVSNVFRDKRSKPSNLRSCCDGCTSLALRRASILRRASTPFGQRMAHTLRVLFFMLLSAAAGLAARADSLTPATQPVVIRSTETMPTVDRIVVRKAQRKMYLMRGDTVLRSYNVKLGLN